jgi:hypothetical protein
MNSVLAIDIGIKTLSMCVLDNKGVIKLWGVYNTLDCETSRGEAGEKRCKIIQKNGRICDKLCSVKTSDSPEFFCKTHSPKDCEVLPYTCKKIKDYTLQELAKFMIISLNATLASNEEAFANVKCVLIELQPSFAVKMKFISHVVYTKLVEFFMTGDTIVKFVKATEKLKVYDGPEIITTKKGYAKRKYESIQHARYFLDNKFSEEQREIWQHVINCSKADDASDALCYAFYYHHYFNNFNKSQEASEVYKGRKIKRIRKYSKKKCKI